MVDNTLQDGDQLYKLKIISPYWGTCTEDQMNRWKIYGTLTVAQPEQKIFNSTIGTLSRKTYIRQMVPQEQQQVEQEESHVEQHIWKLRSEALKNWMERIDMQLPKIRATQQEVKGKLKEEQETDEIAAIFYLATKGNDKSISSRTSKGWRLDRNEAREIPRHLATNRKPQATFANLVGATRFKTIKESRCRQASTRNLRRGSRRQASTQENLCE